MKLTLALLLLALSCASTVLAQTIPDKKAENSPAKQDNSKAQLQLTTSVVERKHQCYNFMGLKVRLAFKNIGSAPIILDKRSFILGIMVSRDPEAAAAKQYETTGRYDLFDGAFFNVDPSDMSNFLVLKPGEVYEKDEGVGSFWIDDRTPPRKGYLKTGTHFLQIQVNTWSYFTDSKLFEKKWRDKGVLWLELMTSLPMPFTIEKDSSLPIC
jgi:hypothetical protein